MKKFLIITMVFALAVTAFALTSRQKKDLADVGIDTYTSGDIKFKDVTVKFDTHGYDSAKTKTVSLTSPTVVINADDASLIIINSDANQTGCRLTGGELYQTVTVLSGTGSNTMRFDDATSMVVGANFTFTEGQSDILEFMCVTAPSTSGGTDGVWARIGNDN